MSVMSASILRPATLMTRPSRSVAGTRTGRTRVRWSRVVMLLLAVAVAATALLAATASGRLAAAAPGPSVRPGDGAVVQPMTALREHTVAPGDTLWSLASSLCGDQDPRPMVDRLMRINGLSAPELQLGEVVLLPNGA